MNRQPMSSHSPYPTFPQAIAAAAPYPGTVSQFYCFPLSAARYAGLSVPFTVAILSSVG
jgi:hypothetical protein